MGQLTTDFENEHERLYGHRSDPDNPMEIVTIRLIGRASDSKNRPALSSVDSSVGSVGDRETWFGKQQGRLHTPLVCRRDLLQQTEGPLLIDEYDTTIVVPPNVRVHCDEHGSIVMQFGGTT